MSDTKRQPVRIAIVDQQRVARLRRKRLKEVAEKTLELEGAREAQIAIALLDDAAIHRINRQHLGHDHPTDVISFGYRNDDGVVEGDIAVSVETARREAERRRVPVEAEVAMYIVHGILHLLGYDDSGPRKRKKMWERQREILAALGYPVDRLFDGA